MREYPAFGTSGKEMPLRGGAMPLEWTGPTLPAKGAGDFAIGELVLSVETTGQE